MSRYEAVVVLAVDAENRADAAERIVKLLRESAQSIEPDWFDGDVPGDLACVIPDDPRADDAAAAEDEAPAAGDVSLWVNERSLEGVFKMLLSADPDFFEKEAN